MGFWEDHAGDAEGGLAFLVEILYPTPLRWCSWPIPIETSSADVCGEYRWRARPLGVISGAGSRQGDVAGAAVVLGNGDGALSPLVGIATGVIVNAYQAGFLSSNKSARPDGVKQILWNRVRTASLNRTPTSAEVAFSLGPPYDFQVKQGPNVAMSSLLRA